MAWVNQRVNSTGLRLSALVECGEGSSKVHVTFGALEGDGPDHFVVEPEDVGEYRSFLQQVDAAILLVREAAMLLAQVPSPSEEWATVLEITAKVPVPPPWAPIGDGARVPLDILKGRYALEILVGQGLVRRSKSTDRKGQTVYRRVE